MLISSLCHGRVSSVVAQHIDRAERITRVSLKWCLGGQAEALAVGDRTEAVAPWWLAFARIAVELVLLTGTAPAMAVDGSFVSFAETVPDAEHLRAVSSIAVLSRRCPSTMARTVAAAGTRTQVRATTAVV